jgi:hypothetical protein
MQVSGEQSINWQALAFNGQTHQLFLLHFKALKLYFISEAFLYSLLSSNDNRPNQISPLEMESTHMNMQMISIFLFLKRITGIKTDSY